MLDLRLDEEQQMVRKTFAEFFDTRFPDAVARLAEHEQGEDRADRGWAADLWPELVGMGILQPTIPVSQGGAGMGQVGAVLIAEELGRALFQSPQPDTLTAADLIFQAGPEGGFWPLLARIAAGATVALAVRQHGGLPDLGTLEQGIRPQGDGWTVSQRKRFVPFARHVDFLLLVLAMPEGLTLFLTPRQRDGLSIRRQDDLGRGELCVVELAQVHLTRGEIVGTLGQARGPYLDALARARIRHSAYLVGLSQGAFDLTLRYARDRRQFGQSIASFQAISFRLAAQTARIEALRWLTYRLAWQADQGQEVVRQAAQAAALAGELAREVTAQGMQIHGSYGLCEDSGIQRYYRRAAVDSMLLGTPGELRDEAVATLADESANGGLS